MSGARIDWLDDNFIRLAALYCSADQSTPEAACSHKAVAFPAASVESRFVRDLIPLLCPQPVRCRGWRLHRTGLLARCGGRIKRHFQSLLSLYQSLRDS